MEAHARYVDRRIGIGGYARVPFGRAWGNCNECASASTVGDLELGALYARSVAAGWAIVAHAGIALPTTQSGQEFALANAVAARIEDLALAIPDGTTVRLGVSSLFRSGRLVAQADVGLDVNVANRSMLPDTSRDGNIAPIVYLGGGIGMDSRFVNIGTEIVATRFNTAGYMMNASLAVRLHLQRFHPYAAIMLPVTNGDFDVAITGGFDVSLP